MHAWPFRLYYCLFTFFAFVPGKNKHFIIFLWTLLIAIFAAYKKIFFLNTAALNATRASNHKTFSVHIIPPLGKIFEITILSKAYCQLGKNSLKTPYRTAGETRTRKGLLPRDFKSLVYTIPPPRQFMLIIEVRSRIELLYTVLQTAA